MASAHPPALNSIERRLVDLVEQRGLAAFVTVVSGASIVIGQVLTVGVMVALGETTRSGLFTAATVAFVVPLFVASGAAYILGRLLLVVSASSTELQRLSNIDPLTGAANRRAFVERAEALIDNHPSLVTVAAMVDVDLFKDVNDRYGHAEGDAVLIALAHSLERAAGQFCDEYVVGRLGGDEFAVVASVPSDECAHALATALNDAAVVTTNLARVTATTGVVIVTDGSIDEALVRADHALYRTKSERRPGREAQPGRSVDSCEAEPQITRQQRPD